MPTSVREQILTAFFGLFTSLSEFPTKIRNPNYVFEPSDLPALAQFDGGAGPLGGDDVSSGISGVMRMALRVNVTVGVRSATLEALGPDISAARASVISAVGADPTLGGLVNYIRYDGEEDPILLVEPGAPPAGEVTINFAIIHTEAELDPYQLA